MNDMEAIINKLVIQPRQWMIQLFDKWKGTKYQPNSSNFNLEETQLIIIRKKGLMKYQEDS